MKKIISLLLCLLIISAPVFAADNTLVGLTGKIAANYADSAVNFINKNYKFDISKEDLYRQALEKILNENPQLLGSALTGMTEGLDNYSTYLDAEEYSSWIESLSGSFVGIGVTIEQRDEYIVVVSPISGSGADIAGILSGDKIVAVDGTNVVGKSIEEVRSMIVGDLGSIVTVDVLRGTETISFTIERCKVEQTTVSYSVTDEGLGYIAISSFAENTPTDVKTALDHFDSKKIKKLIIDVRNNPGGELNSLLDTLRLFMPKGDLLHINYKDEKNKVVFKNDKNNSGKYKIVVLANENSASAAEAFSASMKDAKAATLVGKTTFGKGSMQTLTQLVTGGALKLTVALYQSAGGSFVDGVGVEPNISVRNVTRRLKDNPDYLQMPFSLLIDEKSPADEIESAEFRLKLLSISPGAVDGVYDADLTEGVKKFQEKFGLEVTGKLDIMTQVELDNATMDIKTVVDNQYAKAVEILND